MKKLTKDNLKKEKLLSKDEERKISKQIRELELKLKENNMIKKIQFIESHRDYLNKCYKINSTYYKIISQFADNEYRLYALTFNLNQSIFQYSFISDRISVDWPDIHLDVNLFDIESIFEFGNFQGFLTNKDVEKITEDEFKDALNKKIEQFKNSLNTITSDIEKYVWDYLK